MTNFVSSIVHQSVAQQVLECRTQTDTFSSLSVVILTCFINILYCLLSAFFKPRITVLLLFTSFFFINGLLFLILKHKTCILADHR